MHLTILYTFRKREVQLPKCSLDLPFVIQLRWGAGLEGDIHYATDHFSPDFIQQIPIHLKNILNDMILYPNRKLLMIDVFSKKNKIRFSINGIKPNMTIR